MSTGAGEGNRTPNRRITKPLHYQLRHTSTRPRLSGVSAPWPLERSQWQDSNHHLPLTARALYPLSYIGISPPFSG